jgi:D-lactate dehydrogenase
LPSRVSPLLQAFASTDHRPQRDLAPQALAKGTPERLRDELRALLGADRVLTRAIDLVRFASDASPYRLFPKAVVIARDAEDVRKVLENMRATSMRA